MISAVVHEDIYLLDLLYKRSLLLTKLLFLLEYTVIIEIKWWMKIRVTKREREELLGSKYVAIMISRDLYMKR